MRILALAPHFPYPPNTGSKARTYNILSRLGQSHEVVFACLSHEDVVPDRVNRLQAFCRHIYVERGPNLNTFNRLKWLLHSDPYHVRMFWAAALRIKVSTLVSLQDFDVVYCNHLYTAQYLENNDASTYVSVVDQHDSDYVKWKHLRDKDPRSIVRLIARFNYMKTRRYENKQYPKFDLCFSVSEEDAAATALIAPHGLEIHVAPNGVDIDYFVPTYDEPVVSNSLLFLGTMNARMNIDAAVYFAREIFPRVRARVPDASFVVVGRNPASEVRRLAHMPGITVTGEVPDVRPYLSRSSLVVAPVRLGAGTKLKILEAWAMGKAVVATYHACTGLGVSNGENIVIADEEDAFAAKIAWLLQESPARERIGAKARADIECNYNWDVIVANILTTLEETVRCKQTGFPDR